MAIERLLIAGCGSIGKRHLGIARELLPGADIRVLRHEPSGTPELADGSFSRIEDACAFAPQAAIVANPAPFHAAAAMALAGAGAHLLVEKPLADNDAVATELLTTVLACKRILQVGYNLRFLPSLIEFRKRIRGGSIGSVLGVRCEMGQFLPSWRPGTDYRQGVSARWDRGGGVLLELSHEMDYLRWIFGDVAWVSAWCGRQSSLDIDVEDTAHLTLGFVANGRKRPPVGTLSLDFVRHDTTRLCTAIGEGATLRWNALAGTVEERREGAADWQEVFRHAHQRDDSYRAQLENFFGCIESGEKPRATGEDGLAALRIVAAARRSAAQESARTAVEGMEDKWQA